MMETNTITWLLIADASKAKIYSIHKARMFLEQTNPKNLKLIGQYSHQESRMKSAELVTDRMGEFGSGTFVEATLPKTHEAEKFALELINHISAGRRDNHFRDLIIVAPPTFMGILHKHMPHEIQKLISQKIEKDYTQSNDRELMQLLLTHM